MLSRREIAFVAFVIIGTFAALQYSQHIKKAEIARYYSIIENQEKIIDDVKVTAEDLEKINRCQKVKSGGSRVEECMRSFYDTYAMEQGGERAFAHLARLQKERPELLSSCHYISHGIGHAVFRLSGDDPYKAYTFMSSGGYFKNVVTCGNGFFHGVIEEMAKDVADRDDLVTVLRPICNNKEISNAGGCFHGVGHAAMIQTDYSVEDMVYVCDRISQRPDRVFGCHTGGFMEYGQEFKDAVRVENQKMSFVLCDSLEKKYQPACYLEQSSFFQSYSKEGKNYTRNIGFCKQIGDGLNRMACVKLFAIRAVRLVHYKEIYEMCLNITSAQERVMCTAVMADRIGGSMDSARKSEDYQSVVKYVCDTLNPLYARECKHLVFVDRSRLFFTSEKDLRFSTVDELSKWYHLVAWL